MLGSIVSRDSVTRSFCCVCVCVWCVCVGGEVYIRTNTRLILGVCVCVCLGGGGGVVVVGGLHAYKDMSFLGPYSNLHRSNFPFMKRCLCVCVCGGGGVVGLFLLTDVHIQDRLYQSLL